MLIIDRNEGQSLIIGDVLIKVGYVCRRKQKVRLCFDAPADIIIMREELLDAPPSSPNDRQCNPPTIPVASPPCRQAKNGVIWDAALYDAIASGDVAEEKRLLANKR